MEVLRLLLSSRCISHAMSIFTSATVVVGDNRPASCHSTCNEVKGGFANSWRFARHAVDSDTLLTVLPAGQKCSSTADCGFSLQCSAGICSCPPQQSVPTKSPCSSNCTYSCVDGNHCPSDANTCAAGAFLLPKGLKLACHGIEVLSRLLQASRRMPHATSNPIHAYYACMGYMDMYMDSRSTID